MSFTEAKYYPGANSRKLTASSSVKKDTGVSTAFIAGAFMLLTILCTLVAGRSAAMVSCVILSITVIYCAATNSPLTIPFFLCYAALEGLYKYISGFSQVVYAVKPILELAMLGSLVFTKRMRGASLRMPPLAMLAGVFGGWAAVEIFNPLGVGLIGSICTALVWYIAPVSLFWTSYNSVRSTQQIETICYTIVIVSVVVSLFAALQFQMGQAWTEAHLPGYNIVNQGDWTYKFSTDSGMLRGASWRPASTTSMGGGGALWGMWGAPIGAGLLLSKRTSLLWKLVLLATIGINTYGIIISGCRLYLIATIVEGLILFSILAKSPKELARNLALMMIVNGMIWLGFTAAQSTSGGIIASRYSDTLDNPLAKYQVDRGGLDGRTVMVLDKLDQYPVGVGYQRGSDGRGTDDHPDGSISVGRDDAFNSGAGDMGWLGLILTIVVFFAVMIRGWLSFRSLKTPHLRIVSGILFSLMMGYLVCFFGGPVLTSGDTFWLLLALMLVVPRIQQLEEGRPNAESQRVQRI